jgi:hypothetical protein
MAEKSKVDSFRLFPMLLHASGGLTSAYACGHVYEDGEDYESSYYTPGWSLTSTMLGRNSSSLFAPSRRNVSKISDSKTIVISATSTAELEITHSQQRA